MKRKIKLKIKCIIVDKYKNIITIAYIILLFISTILILQINYKNSEPQIIKISLPKVTQSVKTAKDEIESLTKTEIINQTRVNNLKEYQNMPESIDGHKVVGKLEIPKIELTTYILGYTSKESLNKSVTKLTGPEINNEGNFCITGHNYNNGRMFGKLKQLEIGDKIILTDTYDRSVTYTVNTIDTVTPKEVEVLSQNTLGEREVTLITCTTGALKRIVVRAIEEYD